MSANGRNPDGGKILLITDGAENRPPYMGSLRPKIMNLGITIDAIAYSQNADLKIGELATSTGGKSYFYSGSSSSTALVDALVSTARQTDKDAPILVNVYYLQVFFIYYSNKPRFLLYV